VGGPLGGTTRIVGGGAAGALGAACAATGVGVAVSIGCSILGGTLVSYHADLIKAAGEDNNCLRVIYRKDALAFKGTPTQVVRTKLIRS